jgi:hypothetical protein
MSARHRRSPRRSPRSAFFRRGVRLDPRWPVKFVSVRQVRSPTGAVRASVRHPRCRSTRESFGFGVGISGFFCDRLGLRGRSGLQSALRSAVSPPGFTPVFRVRFFEAIPSPPVGVRARNPVPRKYSPRVKFKLGWSDIIPLGSNIVSIARATCPASFLWRSCNSRRPVSPDLARRLVQRVSS